MSHNIEYFDYPEHVDKRTVSNNLDTYIKIETWREGGSGLFSPIRWLDTVCESETAAKDYIAAHDKGWYDQLAVKYKEYPQFEDTETIKKLLTRSKQLQDKRTEYIKAHSCTNVKAEYIGCSNCGSKLHKEHLRTEYCPVCKADLRSKTTLETIASYDERIKNVRTQITEARRKSAMKHKPKIRWLVKIEYHT